MESNTRNTQAQHTPGPWGISRSLKINGGAHSMHQICDCTSTTVTDAGQQDANARLVAAAPDMEAQLQSAIDTWPEFDNNEVSISGAELVDWFGAFRQNCKDILEKIRA